MRMLCGNVFVFLFTVNAVRPEGGSSISEGSSISIEQMPGNLRQNVSNESKRHMAVGPYVAKVHIDLEIPLNIAGLVGGNMSVGSQPGTANVTRPEDALSTRERSDTELSDTPRPVGRPVSLPRAEAVGLPRAQAVTKSRRLRSESEVRTQDSLVSEAAVPHRRLVICGGWCPEAGLELYKSACDLTGKPAPNVLYMGVATYDAMEYYYQEVMPFLYRNCEVKQLKITTVMKGAAVLDDIKGRIEWAEWLEETKRLMEWADIFVAGSGNTVFMVNKVKSLGLDEMINEFLQSGKVLMAGNEGAILFFDGGLSSSLKPALKKNPDDPAEVPFSSPFEWMRANGLGILPGFFCPVAHDVNRDRPWDRFHLCKDHLKERHQGEYVVAVDESAALIVFHDEYMISGKGMLGAGSGVYTMRYAGGPVLIRQAPQRGKFADLTKRGEIEEDEDLLALANEDNPDDSRPPDRWWAPDPKKEQRYIAFQACDTDRSLAIDAEELVEYFGIDLADALRYIEQTYIEKEKILFRGREKFDDGVLHLEAFVNLLMQNPDLQPQAWDSAHAKWLT